MTVAVIMKADFKLIIKIEALNFFFIIFMRRNIFLFIILVVVLALGGYLYLIKISGLGEAGQATDQPDCTVRLEVSRDDNIFKNKNFGDKIKVEDNRFDGLVLLDATKPKDYANGGGEKIGKLTTPSSLVGFDYRDVAVYLVKNQILKTYWHLGSKVCLADENTDKLDTLYVAHFIGTHEVCTNECETEELDFRVMIEKDSGFIYLAK